MRISKIEIIKAAIAVLPLLLAIFYAMLGLL
jgi:hypothetical protein